MPDVITTSLGAAPQVAAPDGSQVRLLAVLKGGGMAHFSLAPRQVSRAVTHNTVEEIWYFLCGRGRMWRKRGEYEETVTVSAGVSITIPVGTHFQFRSDSDEPLEAIAVTIPPWPGPDEARRVPGVWSPTV